jgi:hypothetical protein
LPFWKETTLEASRELRILEYTQHKRTVIYESLAEIQGQNPHSTADISVVLVEAATLPVLQVSDRNEAFKSRKEFVLQDITSRMESKPK